MQTLQEYHQSKAGEVRDAYATYLRSFYWDTYLTVTFRNTRHDGTNAATAVWERLPFAPTRAFMAVEPNRLDGLHIHALLHHPLVENDTPGRTQAYCSNAFGWSKAEWVASEGVESYVAKYVVKGNEFFFKGMPRFWKEMKT